MRLRSILSEAFRNITTGTTRALILSLLLAAVGAGLAITDARSVIGIQHRAAEFVSAGASVRVMVAPRMTDAAACERLATVPGIRSSGALREADAVVLRTMIANPVQAYAVTPGLLTVLGGDAAGPAGAWISAELAATLGVRPGQDLVTTAGPMTLAGVYDYPDDGRDSRLDYAALLPQPATGVFDECWAQVWPVSDPRHDLLYSALAMDTASTDPVQIGQLNTRLGTEFHGVAEFTDRPTRYALPACALAGLLLGFVAIRMRRLEIAGALHLGEARRALAATLLVETAAWALAGFLLAAAALAAGVTIGTGSAALDVYLIDVRGPAAGALATLVGAVAALATIRERHLFAYFKDR